MPKHAEQPAKTPKPWSEVHPVLRAVVAHIAPPLVIQLEKRPVSPTVRRTEVKLPNSTVQIEEIGQEFNNNVVYFATGANTQPEEVHRFTEAIREAGFNVILLSFDRTFMSTDAVQTVSNYQTMQQYISHDIQRRRELNGDNKTVFSVMGTSNGSLLATMVANASEHVSSLILNTTGDNVGETFMDWPDSARREFKRDLIKQNFDKETLKELWRPISPEGNMDNLRNRDLVGFPLQILLYTPPTDDVYLPEHANRVVDLFTEAGIKPEVVRHPLLSQLTKRVLIPHNVLHEPEGEIYDNHYYMAVINLMLSNKYVNFLKRRQVKNTKVA